MLLEARSSLRFTKLEKRSPAMAKVATRIPTLHPSPINAAQMDVAKTDSTMPRMVFECPNKGWPSTKRAPARNEVATTDALREYQNVVSAIESVPPQERVKCALENELWNRRRLNLHSVGGGASPIETGELLKSHVPS